MSEYGIESDRGHHGPFRPLMNNTVGKQKCELECIKLFIFQEAEVLDRALK